MKYHLLVISILVAWAHPAVQAQSGIAPDRPGIGSGTHTVEPGTVYLEGGVQYFGTGFIDQYSFGQVLLRTGLSDRVELQGQLNSYVFLDVAGVELDGFQDIGIGLKTDLLNASDRKPLDLSVLTSLSFPTGSDDFSNDEVIPSIVLLGNLAISDQWSLDSNLGYTFQFDDLDGQWLFTLTPATAIPGPDNLGLYFGYAGFYTSVDSRHFIEAGLTLLTAPGFQLDLNSGLELEDGDAFIGIGAAKRF